MPIKLILDCDPGVDDALAIAFAAGSPALAIVGVTTVAGNVPLPDTTANALRLRELTRGSWPVTAGCTVPLLRPPISALNVHGVSGLGAAVLPPPLTAPEPGHAADFIVRAARTAPGQLTLVATGPLTNVALALRQEPDLPQLVRRFVIMGGSASRGNVTPAAEFNIAADPEAAAIAFSAGWTVTMIGLDVTARAIVTEAVTARLRALGRLAEDLLLPCLLGYDDAADQEFSTSLNQDAAGSSGPSTSPPGPAVHDVCAMAYLARPGAFRLAPARVEVETAGRWTAGMTVTDFRAPTATCNALVAVRIDVASFWDTVLDAYGRLARLVEGTASSADDAIA